MNHIITYRKNNGELIYRGRLSLPEARIGETTSMGWKVVDIHYEYNGNFLHYEDYCRASRNDRMPLKKKILLGLARKLNRMAR